MKPIFHIQPSEVWGKDLLSCPKAATEEKATSPAPDSYTNELFTGKCAELSVLGTTIPDLLCSPHENRDSVSLSRKIKDHKPNIL